MARSLAGVGARFIGCDRDQVFFMPPSLRDWTVLDAVGELGLSAVYAEGALEARRRPSPATLRRGVTSLGLV